MISAVMVSFLNTPVHTSRHSLTGTGVTAKTICMHKAVHVALRHSQPDPPGMERTNNEPVVLA